MFTMAYTCNLVMLFDKTSVNDKNVQYFSVIRAKKVLSNLPLSTCFRAGLVRARPTVLRVFVDIPSAPAAKFWDMNHNRFFIVQYPVRYSYCTLVTLGTSNETLLVLEKYF